MQDPEEPGDCITIEVQSVSSSMKDIEEIVEEGNDAQSNGIPSLHFSAAPEPRLAASGFSAGSGSMSLVDKHVSVFTHPATASRETRVEDEDNATSYFDVPSTYSTLRDVLIEKFSLKGELFHTMISYRHNTEGQKGNRVAERLNNALAIASITSHQIPRTGWGKYPSFAMEPEHMRPEQVKVFLDVTCLRPGYSWREGFVKGLAKSMVFVPLLSWYPDGTGSIGGLQHLHNDMCDNVLLEIIIALELVRMATQKPLFATRAILPVLLGARTKTGWEDFDVSRIQLLPDTPHQPTIREAQKILNILRVPRDHLEQLSFRSVREIVMQVLAHQGIMMGEDQNVDDAAGKILQSVGHEIKEAPHHPGLFEQERPQGRDVLLWLRQQSLWAYAPQFVRHNLDSLYLIAQLSDPQCEGLVAEYYAARDPVDATRDSGYGDRIRLLAAVRELRKDRRATLLKTQLDGYTDKQVSNFTAMIGGSGIEVALSTPLTRALVLLLAVTALLGGSFNLWAILVSEGGGNEGEGDEEAEALAGVALVVQAVSAGAAGLLLLAAFVQAHVALRPMAAKRTLHRLLLLLLALTTAAAALDALALSKSGAGRRGERGWQLGLSCSFGASLLVLVAVFNLHNRFFLLTFFTLFGVWALVFGSATPPRLGLAEGFSANFSRQTSVLCTVTGLLSLVSASMLLALYAYGRHKARQEVVAMVTKYNRTWELATQGHPESAPANEEGSLPGGVELTKRRGSTGGGGQRRGSSGGGGLRRGEGMGAGAGEAGEMTQEMVDTALGDMATLSGDVEAELEKQRRYWRRLKFRVMRWFGLQAATRKRFAFRYHGKVRQACSDIDELFGHATEINGTFHDMIADVAGEVGVGRLLRGPIKQSGRAIQKAFRCYNRDPSCLTDIVRCTVVFDSLPDMVRFLRRIVDTSQIGFQPTELQVLDLGGDDGTSLNLPRQETIRLLDLASVNGVGFSKKTRITNLKNRTDPNFDVWQSAGFRGVSINIEVGWVMEPNGMPRLLAVEKWEQVDAATHICELQLQLNKMYDLSTNVATYQYYVRWRNLLSR